jgi:TRAP-type C4-dicarboxylate transport system substrate-binding protein
MVPMLKSRYDALPPAARAAIDRFSGEAFAKRFGEFADASNNSTMERVAKQPKNTVTRADAATSEEIRKAVETVTTTWRAQKPRNEHVYKVLQAELTKIRGGK